MKYMFFHLFILWMLASCEKNLTIMDLNGEVIHNTIDINTSNVVIRNGHLVGDGEGAGIRIISNNGPIENIRLEDLEIEGFRTGIEIAGMDPINNIRIARVNIHHNVNGLYSYAAPKWQKNRPIQHLRLHHVVSHDNYGDPLYTDNHSGSGFILGNVENARLRECEAYNNGGLNNSKALNGPVGMWCYNSRDVQFVQCYSHHNRTRPGHLDGGGFDTEGSTDVAFIQCVSEYNAGPGFLLWQFSGADPGGMIRVDDCTSKGDDIPFRIGVGIETIEINRGYYENDRLFETQSLTRLNNVEFCGKNVGSGPVEINNLIRNCR